MKISKIIVCIVVVFYFSLISSRVVFGESNNNRIDIGEVLKILDKIKNSQDVSAVIDHKELRNEYNIPPTVQVLSPSGGEDVIVFVYDAKEYTNSKSENISSPDKIRHITSINNLRRVFLLFYYEPFTIYDNANHKNHYAIAVLPSGRVKMIENKQSIQLSANLPVYIKSAGSVLVLKFRK